MPRHRSHTTSTKTSIRRGEPLSTGESRRELSGLKSQSSRLAAPAVLDATLGYFFFTALVFTAAAYPFFLPFVYLAFFAFCMPIRFYDFSFRGNPRGYNKLFLLDFCYLVNTATAVYFALYLAQTRWDAAELLRMDGERLSKRKFVKSLIKKVVLLDRVGVALYALADGPVAMALIAWANAWAFHSQEHVISVLIHLLPGLALFSWIHLPRVDVAALKACSALLKTPDTALYFGSCATLASPPIERSHREDDIFMWVIGVPMFVYVFWQVWYLLVVEFLLRDYQIGLDTSFKCLGRRERRRGDASIWNRIVFSGSRTRQVLAFAGVQSLFTLCSLLAFVPTYYHWQIGLAWQVAKVALPLHYGAKFTYGRMIDQRVSARLASMSIFSFTSRSGSENGHDEDEDEVASLATALPPKDHE